MASWLRLPRSADIAGLYLLLALALLAPFGSNDILPWFPDHANHAAFVVEARLALDEGQLPLRVAPFASDGLRYPLFQFYSQSPYVLSGLIHKFVTPTNPWLAIKLTYLLGLCLAAFFVFKLGRLLDFDRAPSAIAGVVYVTAPYLLINMYARAAYAEAFAQLVVPMVAYTSARAVVRRHPLDLVWAALAWALLGTSHIITFIYATLFFAAFVVGLLVIRQLTLISAAWCTVPCLLGWGLSAFQWYPAAVVRVVVHAYLGDPFSFGWLTPLSGLLSFTSLPPEPAGRDIMTPDLHPAVGAPIVIAVAGLLYFRTQGRLPSRAVWVCMFLFATAFVAVWSPVNFWAWLPPQFLVVQFTYRLLTFTTIFGTMLVVYFLWIYDARYGPTSALPWLVGILLLTQSYLTPSASNVRTLASIVAAPVINISPQAYESAGDAPALPQGLPLVRIDETRRSCGLDGAVIRCTVNLDTPAAVQLPMLFYPTLLRVTVNREPVEYYASEHGSKRLATLALAPGKHRIAASFRGSPIGNTVSLAALLVVGILCAAELMGRRRWLRVKASLPPDADVVSTTGPTGS